MENTVFDSEKTNLDKSVISIIKIDINKLREVLDMLEWCVDGNSNNVQLWVVDVIPKANEVIKHFQ